MWEIMLELARARVFTFLRNGAAGDRRIRSSAKETPLVVIDGHSIYSYRDNVINARETTLRRFSVRAHFCRISFERIVALTPAYSWKILDGERIKIPIKFIVAHRAL